MNCTVPTAVFGATVAVRSTAEDLDLRDTTMWCHISKAERARWRPLITEFAAAEAAAAAELVRLAKEQG
ncbi:hypothetical protein, partial [Rhodococcus sp. C3V]|uniref:hypothetical protein n=1 Tax=Rhodococcus sp. C3V TaxID=3034165 RepID=UPI0023E092CC